MASYVYLIVSTDHPPLVYFSNLIEQGELIPVRQDRLSADLIENAAGLIASAGVDQIDLMERRESLEAMLNAGGRMWINGHILRPYIHGLRRFIPLQKPKRSDYALTRLADHPIFEGVSARSLETNQRIAGFYGRGHNPPPEGAIALTGLGPQLEPVDWVWRRPQGGEIFVHAGNDLWGMGDDPEVKKLLARRAVAWCYGGQKATA